MAAVLALLAAGLFGGADFLGGVATKKASAWSVTLLAHGVGAVLVLGVQAVIGGAWSREAVIWGIVGGFAGTLGLVLLLDALARGQFQLISPLSALTGTIVPVAVGLLRSESPSTLGWVGLTIALPAVWLLTGGATATRPTEVRPLVQAVLAGLGFGLFFVALAQTPDGAGAVPLVAARLSSVPFLAVVAAITTGPVLPRTGRVHAAGSGMLDMTANGLFLLATRTGQLAVIGALVALYPASNALLARTFLGERLLGSQKLGFALTIAAAALLSR